MKKFLLIFLIAFPSIAEARCLGIWEVSRLARGTHSGYNLKTQSGDTMITVPMTWVRKLNEISNKIDQASGLYKKFFICGNRTVNAFATNVSGANAVFIHTGLIEKAGSDWDMYAALLGHENAHLVHHHGSQRQMRKLGINLLEMLAKAALASMADKGSIGRSIGEEVIGVGGQAVYASYSRDDESEADRSGLNYAYRAGFDPYGSIRLHKLLAGSSDFLSSHPSSANRISALTAQIASLSSSQSQVASTTQSSAPRPRATLRTPYTRPTPPSSSPSSNSATSIIRETRGQGQPGSGVVLKVKARYSYYIASQSNFETPVKGAIAFVNIGGRKIRGTVERVIGGYFSVLADASIDDSLVGGKVVFQ